MPIDLSLRDEMYPRLNMAVDGVSEFSFANLWLFRRRYKYRVARIKDTTLVLSGEHDGKRFFMTPCAIPDCDTLAQLFATHDYWKNLSDRLIEPVRICLEEHGYTAREDRDNFDYLYVREDLACLSGKKYHKKRNLVNSFTSSYTATMERYTKARLDDAIKVLDTWRDEKGHEGDYIAAREALENADFLGLDGALWYVNGEAVAWCLGERLARGRMYAIHFEKAIEGYKGIYQFVNQAWAAALPNHIREINREQDLGDEGLRQAKLTYRPSGFVRKYVVFPKGRDPGEDLCTSGELHWAEGIACEDGPCKDDPARDTSCGIDQ